MRANGFPHAERRVVNHGGNDIGDILGAPGLTIEVKDHATLRWPLWLKQLAAEKARAGSDHAVLVAKQRGKGNAGEWYAMMPFDDWLRLARAAGFGDEPSTE